MSLLPREFHRANSEKFLSVRTSRRFLIEKATTALLKEPAARISSLSENGIRVCWLIYPARFINGVAKFNFRSLTTLLEPLARIFSQGIFFDTARTAARTHGNVCIDDDHRVGRQSVLKMATVAPLESRRTPRRPRRKIIGCKNRVLGGEMGSDEDFQRY